VADVAVVAQVVHLAVPDREHLDDLEGVARGLARTNEEVALADAWVLEDAGQLVRGQEGMKVALAVLQREPARSRAAGLAVPRAVQADRAPAQVDRVRREPRHGEHCDGSHG
jgi:hypothetical protein